jgi:hypothetical protein
MKDNSLSIVLFSLFALCISGNSLAGWLLQNETLAAHGRAWSGYGSFLSTGVFLEGLASNWQAAVLRLGSLIVFSTFLYQRCAPHSRDPRAAKPRKWRRTTGPFAWIYGRSLFLAFLILFMAALVLHILAGAKAYNEGLALMGRAQVSIGVFLLSAQFWSSTLQTWQAEYLVIGIYVVLTIFLRQEDSPESKPIEARNKTTGEANK